VKRLLVVLVLAGSIVTAPARAEKLPLASMFEEAAHIWEVPAALTQAIARVESGLSPWALNIEGKGYHYDSKEKALAKAKEAEAEGRSFDSGIMQVNNFWLKKYGIPLEAALDPLANIYLGSWILKQEIDRHGESWGAVGAYHSPNKTRGRMYAEMVKDALAKGPVSAPARTVASDNLVKELKPTFNKRKSDNSPLVVIRLGSNQIARSGQQQVNVVSFIQRLNRNKI
jgi:soluble lytic murein transglycosylase-like protein